MKEVSPKLQTASRVENIDLENLIVFPFGCFIFRYLIHFFLHLRIPERFQHIAFKLLSFINYNRPSLNVELNVQLTAKTILIRNDSQILLPDIYLALLNSQKMTTKSNLIDFDGKILILCFKNRKKTKMGQFLHAQENAVLYKLFPHLPRVLTFLNPSFTTMSWEPRPDTPNTFGLPYCTSPRSVKDHSKFNN